MTLKEFNTYATGLTGTELQRASLMKDFCRSAHIEFLTVVKDVNKHSIIISNLLELNCEVYQTFEERSINYGILIGSYENSELLKICPKDLIKAKVKVDYCDYGGNTPFWRTQFSLIDFEILYYTVVVFQNYSKTPYDCYIDDELKCSLSESISSPYYVLGGRPLHLIAKQKSGYMFKPTEHKKYVPFIRTGETVNWNWNLPEK